MIEFFQSRARSFRCAFAGLWFVMRTQRNAWIHIIATVMVALLSFWLRIPARDWAVIVVAVAMVWTMEFINTALEATVDLACPDQNDLAMRGKDIGAAAVLIASINSILIGLLILGPPLSARIQALWES